MAVVPQCPGKTSIARNANAHNAGFSEVKPWLPVDQQHRLQAVAEQEK